MLALFDLVRVPNYFLSSSSVYNFTSLQVNFWKVAEEHSPTNWLIYIDVYFSWSFVKSFLIGSWLESVLFCRVHTETLSNDKTEVGEHHKGKVETWICLSLLAFKSLFGSVWTRYNVGYSGCLACLTRYNIHSSGFSPRGEQAWKGYKETWHMNIEALLPIQFQSL